MGIFSKLFASPDERKVKRLYDESQERAKEFTKPLGAIGLAIVQAAKTCSEKLKSNINAPEKEKQQAEMYVFFEFVYFFMHLTMRSAFSQLPEPQIRRLQSYLGPLICSTAIDSFVGHWPENLKKGMHSDFYSKLNDAEIEYSSCKELLSEKPFTGNGLFEKLGLIVADLSGQQMNPVTIMLVIECSLDAYKSMNLDSLVSEAGKTLTKYDQNAMGI
jgi:hypothetical protein